MGRFLVRVALADRPGALGAVASRIGAVRGDMVGVEILDRRDGRALDDFLVELPDDAVDLLVSEIEEVDGAFVEAVHPVHGAVGDGRLDAYEGAAALMGERSPEGMLQVLVRLARRQLAADWSAVVDMGAAAGPRDGQDYVGDLVVLCEDGPVPANSRLLLLASDPPGTNRLPVAEIAWAPLATWDVTLVAGRPARRFVQAERDRLAAIARLGEARWSELSRSRSLRVHPAQVG